MRRPAWCGDMGTPSRALVATVGLATSLVALFPSACSGQIQRTLGFHVGQVRSHQIWTGPTGTGTANGFSLGINVDVPTPAPLLSILAELSLVRRGSLVWDEVADPEGVEASAVRSHYLSVPFLGKVNFRLGPTSLYFLAGPTVDLLLNTTCTQDFCSVLQDDRPTVFAATVGSGISMDFGDRFRTDLEVRVTEGLSNAYVVASSDVRYRSLGFLLRACIPF